jgi:hypothetical protein
MLGESGEGVVVRRFEWVGLFHVEHSRNPVWNGNCSTWNTCLSSQTGRNSKLDFPLQSVPFPFIDHTSFPPQALFDGDSAASLAVARNPLPFKRFPTPSLLKPRALSTAGTCSPQSNSVPETLASFTLDCHGKDTRRCEPKGRGWQNHDCHQSRRLHCA